MFLRGQRIRRVLLATLFLAPMALAHGCGGLLAHDPEKDDPGGSGGKPAKADAGKLDAGGTGSGGTLDAGSDAMDSGLDAAEDAPFDAAEDAPAMDAAFDVYEDPGCPDAEAPPGYVECDVFGNPSGCEAGDGCYPYVEHPFGEGCDVQTFGAVCYAAGTGTQGAECGSGTEGCAAGYICVVGAKPGKRCVQMCDLDAPNPCPDGLICGETDVEGVGVCA